MLKLKLLCCIVTLFTSYNSFSTVNDNPQIPSSPSKHKTIMPPKIPNGKLGNKASTVNLGSCKYLDYYVYYCKPFTCSLNMPVPGNFKTTFRVDGMKGSNCSLSYKYDIKTQGDYLPLKVECLLTPEAVESFRYQWKYYGDGYIDVFTRRSEDPLLKKQCQPKVEF